MCVNNLTLTVLGGAFASVSKAQCHLFRRKKRKEKELAVS